MDLNYSAEDERFRDTVRAFLDAKLPDDLRHKVLNHLRLTKEDFLRWHRIVNEQGWVGASWPKEHGGTGWKHPAPLPSSSRCEGATRGNANSCRG